ncbi:DUF1674 domain-containing protein [Rhodomicrobium sp.]|uniref:DUF1674 domain-containing protein n=1 Tax=Rhodomicrobium sp. TaxID=2720632 RepID=UPI0039E26C69
MNEPEGLAVARQVAHSSLMTAENTDKIEPDEAEIERRRKEAAKRALAEAEARRLAAGEVQLPREIGSRKGGLEPTRFGDWEKKGIASDF